MQEDERSKAFRTKYVKDRILSFACRYLGKFRVNFSLAKISSTVNLHRGFLIFNIDRLITDA